MITCLFEDGGPASLRHITTDVILLNPEQTEVLLVRRSAQMIEAHKWCLPGGYLSRDESLAEGASREVREETGYEALDLKPFIINDFTGRPNEKERQNVPVTFIARIGPKVSSHDHETEEIGWHALDNLPPEHEIAFDHYKLLMEFVEYRKQPYAIPVIKQVR